MMAGQTRGAWRAHNTPSGSWLKGSWQGGPFQPHFSRMAASWVEFAADSTIGGITKRREASGGWLSPRKHAWGGGGRCPGKQPCTHTVEEKQNRERSCLHVKKRKVVRHCSSLWGKVMSRKRCGQSWLFDKENKDCCHLDLKNIQQEGKSRPSRTHGLVSSLLHQSSRAHLPLPVFSSLGCHPDTSFYVVITLSLHDPRFILSQTLNKNWFTNLWSFLILYCKPLNLISVYHCMINYTHLKMDVSTRLFSPFTFQHDQRAWL